MKSIRTDPSNHAPEGDERLGTVIFNVWWEEDPTKTRDVTAWCKTCVRFDPRGEEGEILLVSPQGIAHHTDSDYGDRTICGHDATGPEWWWRL